MQEDINKVYENCKLAGKYLIKKYPNSKTCKILNQYMRKGNTVPERINIIDIDLEEVKSKAKKELEKEVSEHIIGYINRFVK